ncbi:MAG: homocysteine S-methyltransferase family protein, partial [Candidatus Sericytochromatia bacterium]
MPAPFRELLASGRLILFDGGLGTMLYSKGVFLNTNFDLVNLQSPQLVQELHELYLEAGADVIETNTFGANPYKLKAHGLEEQVHAINLAGAQIARRAAGDLAYVAGSIGPLGIKIEPLGPTSFAEAQAAFETQVLPLLEGGVDLFVVETFTNLDELVQAVAAIRKHSDLPILASVTVDDDGNTIYGTPPERFTPRLDALVVDMLGLYCSVGPKPRLDACMQMSEWTVKPLAAQPNA